MTKGSLNQQLKQNKVRNFLGCEKLIEQTDTCPREEKPSSQNHFHDLLHTRHVTQV